MVGVACPECVHGECDTCPQHILGIKSMGGIWG